MVRSIQKAIEDFADVMFFPVNGEAEAAASHLLQRGFGDIYLNGSAVSVSHRVSVRRVRARGRGRRVHLVRDTR
jgi:hypothetical protein